MKIYDAVNTGVKDVVITPSTSNIIKPAGGYDGKITIQGDTNLIAGNILSGKSIFGVAGSASPKLYANGSVTSSNGVTLNFTNANTNASVALPYVTVGGLTFQPTLIMVTRQNDNTFYTSLANLSAGYSGQSSDAYTDGGGNIWIHKDGTNLYANSAGFQLPVGTGNTSYNWYAFA